MEESRLRIIALVLLIIGLPLLYLSSQYVGEKTTRENSDLGVADQNSLTGRVYSVSQKGELTLLKVSKTIPVIIKDKIVLKCGSVVEFDGYYQNYKGQPEFVASKYSIIKESKNGACGKEQ
ncbi:MAG: hypothetical protein AABX52_00210 [Nanoarchaeota archaeon]